MGQKNPANISVLISFLTEGGHRLKRSLTVKSGQKNQKHAQWKLANKRTSNEG